MAKRRKRRDRQREPQSDVVTPEPVDTAADPDWRLPSPPARVAGVALAILTLVIAVVTVTSSFSGDLAAIDAGVRLVVGLLLIALAIGIAALAIAPAFVRGLIVRS